MQNKNLPIGYWIKEVDHLLTKGIDEIQSSYGLTRTAWQILNIISGKHFIVMQELATLTSVFVNNNEVENMVAKFEEEQLISKQEHNISLTDKGKKLHAICLEEQQKFRQTMMINVSEQDYQTTISTLQKIVENSKTR